MSKRIRKLLGLLIARGGVVGETALREATGENKDLSDLMMAVRSAIAKKLHPHDDDPWVCVEALFSDRAIILDDGKYFSYPYVANDDLDITVGEPSQVEREWKPIGSEMRESAPMGDPLHGSFIEALPDRKGTAFRVCIIKSGMSGNQVNYPPAVLREATPLFEGVRVFVKADVEHLRGGGKDFNKLIGRIVEPQFVEAKGGNPAQVTGVLEVFESVEGIAAKLREAVDRQMTDLFGFSIDALGRDKRASGYREAVAFTKVNSVDLIVEPGAGGEVISFVEALNEDSDMTLRERMLAKIKEHNPSALKSLDTQDDEAVEVAYREALDAESRNGQDPSNEPAPSGAEQEGDDPVSQSQFREAMDQERARTYAARAINDSNLPEAAKGKLSKQFLDNKDARFTEAAVDQAINDEREYLAQFNESGHIRGLGGDDISGGQDRSEKIQSMLDDFFDATKRNRPRSFRECYREITGDMDVTGDLRNCDVRRLREAVGLSEFRESLDSTSFSNVLGDSITRAMVREYQVQDRYDIWRPLVDIVPVSDFRVQERTRYGGYGDLPTVAESGSYDPLSSPTDEKATYSISKRGGTEDVTLEMIANDDVGVIQRIPMKLAVAAKRTLSKFVLNFLRTNPAIYTGDALFHANHANLLTAALDATALSAARLQMLKQTESTPTSRLG